MKYNEIATIVGKEVAADIVEQFILNPDYRGEKFTWHWCCKWAGKQASMAILMSTRLSDSPNVKKYQAIAVEAAIAQAKEILKEQLREENDRHSRHEE